MVVSVGETIKIPCIPPDGYPEPTIEWFKGNNFLSLVSDRIDYANGYLKIESIKESGNVFTMTSV